MSPGKFAGPIYFTSARERWRQADHQPGPLVAADLARIRAGLSDFGASGQKGAGRAVAHRAGPFDEICRLGCLALVGVIWPPHRST
jgi:hypothetical protein